MAMQVVVQDQTDRSRSLAHGAALEASAPAAANGGQHAHSHAEVLQPFYEYLSFLFRRPPAAPEHVLMEMGYRDHLQARTPATPDQHAHTWQSSSCLSLAGAGT